MSKIREISREPYRDCNHTLCIFGEEGGIVKVTLERDLTEKEIDSLREQGLYDGRGVTTWQEYRCAKSSFEAPESVNCPFPDLYGQLESLRKEVAEMRRNPELPFELQRMGGP